MSWELKNDRPIWFQLADLLTQRILTGQYPSGVRIASVRDLAAEAGVNPNTMQRALSYLEETGLLTAQRNTGRFVTQDTELIRKTRTALAEAELSAFLSRMRCFGLTREDILNLLEGNHE